MGVAISVRPFPLSLARLSAASAARTRDPARWDVSPFWKRLLSAVARPRLAVSRRRSSTKFVNGAWIVW
jgi:hypothetical protein